MVAFQSQNLFMRSLAFFVPLVSYYQFLMTPLTQSSTRRTEDSWQRSARELRENAQYDSPRRANNARHVALEMGWLDNIQRHLGDEFAFGRMACNDVLS